MHRSFIISESQYKRLFVESLSSKVFHFTGISNGYEICKDNVILLQSAYSKDADNYGGDKKYYLSLTRVRNSLFGYSNKFSKGGVRIELDGDLLNRRFSGKPINYWNGLLDKFEYSRQKDSSLSDSSRQQVSTENEDRLFSNEPYISNIYKYIVSIDVLLPQNNVSDSDKMNIASSFLKTPLSRKIKIFDSLEEFNKIGGKDINDKIEFNFSLFGLNNASYKNSNYNIKRALSAIIGFISYGNKDFEKNYGKEVRNLLDKYNLSQFSESISEMKKENDNISWGFNGIIERLDASRRDLSDKPTMIGHNVLRMMTDYFNSLGAKSFRDAIRIKKKLSDDYFSKKYGQYASTRIDTMRKFPLLLCKSSYIISLQPNVDKFKDVVRWNDDVLEANADYITQNEIPYDNEGAYHYTSKNMNSLRLYLVKLFKKGSVSQVLSVLKKIGFNDEKLKDLLSIEFVEKEMDYYDACHYNTVNSSKIYDYRKQDKVRDEEIEEYWKNNGALNEN